MTGGFGLPLDTERAVSDDLRWAGLVAIKGPSWARMPLITVTMLGLQIVWSVEMGYASPYLLSLGMSKSLMSMVFVAGPLSGLIMQPIVGVLADRSTSRFGRRRPYMLIGSIVCAIALLLLGFTRPVASIFGLGEKLEREVTVVLAVFSIYFIDFSINAVMATDRALLVDILPASDQELGNAWAGRLAGLGSIAGFFVGNIPLSTIFPYFGRTQLEVLSVLSAIILLLTHGITCWAVKEKVLLEPPKHSMRNRSQSSGVLFMLKEIWSNLLTLPSIILQICIIQFLSWIGWFPVLFYTTLWVSDIYYRTSPSDLDEAGTRAGNRALLWSSLVAMAGFVVLPMMATRRSIPGNGASLPRKSQDEPREAWWKIRVITFWIVSNAVFAIAMFATLITDSVWGANVIIGATGFSWAISLWAPFALLGEAIHSSSPRSDYALASSTADDELQETPIPLADRRTRLSSEVETNASLATGSIPFALHGSDGSSVDGAAVNQAVAHRARVSRANLTDGSAGDLGDPKGHGSPSYLHGDRSPLINGGAGAGEGDEDEDAVGMGVEHGGIGDKAGIILGIHNVFVVIPQFLVTGLSSIIFAIFEPNRSNLRRSIPASAFSATVRANPSWSFDVLPPLRRTNEEPRPFDSIGLMFRIGGVSAMIACWLCVRLSKQLR